MLAFDPQLAEQFLTALRAAFADADAAAYVGLDVETIEDWRDEFGEFDERVRRVRAEQLVLNAGRVRQAARDDWRVALVLVQRAEQDREFERLRELTTDRT